MAANFVIRYSVPGDSVSVRAAECGNDPTAWVEEQVGDELWVWRAPDGSTAMLELLGWAERTPEEWRAAFPPDLPLDADLLQRIEDAVARESLAFCASGRYPEYAAAVAPSLKSAAKSAAKEAPVAGTSETRRGCWSGAHSVRPDHDFIRGEQPLD